MLLDHRIFRIAELSRFPEYLGRDLPFADIIIESAEDKRSLFILGKSEPVCKCPAQKSCVKGLGICELVLIGHHIIDEIKEKNKEYSYTEESFEIDVNKELLSELEKLGVNIEAGIKFCGEEFDMYKSMLEAYANEEKEKSSHMIKSYEAKNWNDYGVYAHSLKSTSRTLGANELADIAYILEMAAKEGDDQTIIENHEKVMELYSKMVNVIREYTNLEKADDGDDEIMEFFPEG